MKTLVAGWFSFEEMGATAGDLITRDVVCRWLEQAGCDYDVALCLPFRGGVNWGSVDPAKYSRVVFVCGPFGNGWPIPEFLERFKGCQLMGLNLSMVEPLEQWNPFDLLLERDSSRAARPDLSFIAEPRPVPVVGVVLVHAQTEYKGKGLHHEANEAIRRLQASRAMASVPIDTRLDLNATGLRQPAEVESLIARMDVVVTTRLHGMVLALKNGIPAIAIDPIEKGAKISRQAETIGWPVVFTADALRDEELQKAFDYCLTKEARAKVRECSECAAREVDGVGIRFIAECRRNCESPGR